MTSGTNGGSISIVEEPIARLDQHREIPIAFEVTIALEVSLRQGGLDGFDIHEEPVEVPWTKDYDAIEGEGPTHWATRFDVSNWCLLAAYDAELRVGGCRRYLCHREPEHASRIVSTSRFVWDLRVRPEFRGAGIGSDLFTASETWARARGYRSLRVETQNINVPACRFYKHMGCTLRSVDRFAYPDLPNEVQLVWSKEL